MTPVLTARNGTRQVYLPGSSLKGTFRSHVEKVIGTLRPNDQVVCDPFQQKSEPNQSCSIWFERRPDKKDITNAIAYRDECPACRLFGSTRFIGRVSIGDAYLVNENPPQPTEQRDGVGIDRLTGGAAHGAKFDLEVVSAEVQFRTQILLRNFECWQLGAILVVVQDLEDQLVRIGSGKSRGLGSVEGSIAELHIAHLGPTSARPPTSIWGLGRFLGADTSYGTVADDEMTITSAPNGETRGLRTIQTFRGEALAALKQAAIDDFVRRIDAYPPLRRAMERAR
jgi:CRISPR-associated RAMP protein (TIGR02581 family)